MAQNTVLAAGTTAATSSNIVVDPGNSVTVGLFAATSIPHTLELKIYQDTPSGDNCVARLSGYCRTTVLSGPGTFRVRRAAGSFSVGVFTET